MNLKTMPEMIARLPLRRYPMFFRPVWIHLRPAWFIVASLSFAVFAPNLLGQDDERLWLTTTEDAPQPQADLKPQAETKEDQQQAQKKQEKKRAEN